MYHGGGRCIVDQSGAGNFADFEYSLCFKFDHGTDGRYDDDHSQYIDRIAAGCTAAQEVQVDTAFTDSGLYYIRVTAKVVTLPGEGMALALCQLIPIKFGYVKIMVDVSLVVIAAALSLIFLHGLQGVREGTVAAAVFVGMLAKQLNRFMIPFGQKLFRSSEKKKETAGTVKS